MGRALGAAVAASTARSPVAAEVAAHVPEDRMAGWIAIGVGTVLVVAGTIVGIGGMVDRWYGEAFPTERTRVVRRWAGGGTFCLGVVAALAGASELARLRFVGGGLWVVFLLGVVVIATRIRSAGA